MKKYTCFALLALLMFLVLMSGCKKDDPEPASAESLAGGFTEDRELTTEDWEVFLEAVDLDGVSYVPTLVATQVVAGTNYRFTATGTPVVPDPESFTAYVYVFKPLEGPAELVDIARIE